MKKLLCGEANRIFHQGSFGGRVAEYEGRVRSWSAGKETELRGGVSCISWVSGLILRLKRLCSCSEILIGCIGTGVI